jgi:hypothetical protein
MDGPSIRSFPRIELHTPLELRTNGTAIRLQGSNVSAGGLFVESEDLPLGTTVHVTIAGVHPFEADGVVRYHSDGGVGIEFVPMTEPVRRGLDKLIAELTAKGLPVC